MMTNRTINNVDELNAEIARLESLQLEQENYLKDQVGFLQQKAEGPLQFFKRMSSWMPKGGGGPKMFTGANAHADWLTNTLRVTLPFIFNKVIFRRAGFIKKALLLFASQKAASVINQERVTSVIDKIASFIRPNKTRKPVVRDYGIPPDSETY